MVAKIDQIINTGVLEDTIVKDVVVVPAITARGTEENMPEYRISELSYINAARKVMYAQEMNDPKNKAISKKEIEKKIGSCEYEAKLFGAAEILYINQQNGHVDSHPVSKDLREDPAAYFREKTIGLTWVD